MRNEGNPSPYRYSSYEVYRADKTNHVYQFNAYLNLTSQDVTQYFPTFIYQSAIKTITGKELKVTTSPFPPIYVFAEREQ
jgi:hypothetical protein